MNRPIIVRRFRGIVRYTFPSGYIESWGRGIEKIAHACQQHGIQPPTYDSGMSGLMLSFNASESYLSSINPEAADPVTGEVTTQETTQKTTQERILALLRISPHLTRRRNIESRGRGIERINRKCLAHGIDAPIHDYSVSGLMLTFRASPQHLLDAPGYQDARRILGEKVGERVGKRSEKRSEKELPQSLPQSAPETNWRP